MRRHEAVGQSYAKALFALAKERRQADAVARELTAVADLLAREPALREFLARPWVAAAAKRRAAAEVSARLEVSALVRDLLGLVAAHGRTGALPAIVAAYRDLLDADAGRVRARVRTAVPLTGSARAALAGRLARALAPERGAGVTVMLDETVDRSLLGGFVAEIGSVVVDASLDGQLARLRKRLARG